MIYAAGQVGREIGDLIFAGKLRDIGHGKRWIVALGKSSTSGAGIWNEHPNKTVVLFAGKISGENTLDFEVLIGGERWDQLTLTGVNIKFSSVVSAFHLMSIELPAAERHAAVGAGVLQGKHLALPITPDHERRSEKHSLLQSASPQLIRR